MLHKELPAPEREAKLRHAIDEIEFSLGATQERIDDVNRRRADMVSAIADAQREVVRFDERLVELIASRSTLSARYATHIESLNGTLAELAALEDSSEAVG